MNSAYDSYKLHNEFNWIMPLNILTVLMILTSYNVTLISASDPVNLRPDPDPRF